MKLPLKCPSCEHGLQVKSMQCENCGTVVSGSYNLPPLGRMELTDQDFILDFVKASGSLKVMAQKLKLSYPTVRNKLDEIIQRLERIKDSEKTTK